MHVANTYSYIERDIYSGRGESYIRDITLYHVLATRHTNAQKHINALKKNYHEKERKMSNKTERPREG
jgi:nucleosome binding factor SPN SPT16 subunit